MAYAVNDNTVGGHGRKEGRTAARRTCCASQLDSMDEEYDVAIVGAGVAGGALATALARDGRRVLVVERELYKAGALVEPDRIVGELLQPGGYACLLQLGLREALEGIDAREVLGYGMFLGGRSECIKYSAEEGVTGRSFHNGRFLRRLREIASGEGVQMAEGNVTGLVREAGRVVGVVWRDEHRVERQCRAKLTIACDGCGSNLRKRAGTAHIVSVYSKFYGLLLDMVDLPFPCHGHVVLADPAPILFYPVSSTQVRCLVDIPSSVTGDAATHMVEKLAPQVPEMFRGPFLDAVRGGDMKSMPNRVMPAVPGVVPGALLLGDSFNMRHPLTGGGMTVALSDVLLIRGLLREVKDLSDNAALSSALELFYTRRTPLSTTINILANALYSLFCATDDPALAEMREACFDYLCTGGRMTHDPMGMLGGLKPNPYLLVTHFFAVALYGCGRALLPFPTPSRVSRAWSIFRASFNIVKPLIDAERLPPFCWLPFSSM